MIIMRNPQSTMGKYKDPTLVFKSFLTPCFLVWNGGTGLEGLLSAIRRDPHGPSYGSTLVWLLPGYICGGRTTKTGFGGNWGLVPQVPWSFADQCRRMEAEPGPAASRFRNGWGRGQPAPQLVERRRSR